jgi:hypothetical protein
MSPLATEDGGKIKLEGSDDDLLLEGEEPDEPEPGEGGGIAGRMVCCYRRRRR